MKEGFDTLKDSIDLAAYSVDGFIGLMLFIIIGMIMTIVIQSSSAAMAIVITALAGGNILYLDALALAIGANIGTTVTAVMGALTSNQNGKRLAFVHFIFNGITGLLALVLIYQLKDLVDIISPFIGIADENYSMKLALFHTIFNLLGIVVLFPFIALIVKLSEKIINDDKMRKESRPLYLDMANLKLPYNAMISIQKEVINLYDKAQKALLHALSIHTKDLVKREDIDKILKNKPSKIDTNLDEIYKNNLKELYSEIIKYALLSQENMTKEQHEYVAQLKIASNVIVKILKDTRDIQKNMDLYLNSKNEFVKKEYLDIKGVIVNTIFSINQLKDSNHDEVEISTIIQMDKDKLQDFELMYSERIDNLIRSEKITSKMATSLINDSTTVFNICRNLYRIANILFIKDEKLRMLGDIDNETEKNI
jgi:phosphate:Na+ symporter